MTPEVIKAIEAILAKDDRVEPFPLSGGKVKVGRTCSIFSLPCTGNGAGVGF